MNGGSPSGFLSSSGDFYLGALPPALEFQTFGLFRAYTISAENMGNAKHTQFRNAEA